MRNAGYKTIVILFELFMAFDALRVFFLSQIER